MAPGLVELPAEDADEDRQEDDAEEAEYDDDRTGVAPSHCSIVSSGGQTSDSSPGFRGFLCLLSFLDIMQCMLYYCIHYCTWPHSTLRRGSLAQVKVSESWWKMLSSQLSSECSGQTEPPV